MSDAVLTGRESELEMLAGLVRELTLGNGGSLLLEGEPGIGKSSLVRAALADAGDLGFQVSWGAGDELGQSLPLVPFLDALRVRSHPDRGTRRDAIVRLLDGAGADDDRGTDVPAVLAEQLLALIAEECAARPMVLVIDDLQWADTSSVRLWSRLARSARQMPLVLVGMMRPAPIREDLITLRRMVAADAVRASLSGLSDDAVAGLVESLAGGEPDDGLLRLAAAAGGNPLYLTELVDAAKRSAMITITGGAAELAPGPVPGSLSAVIAERLGVVSDTTRDVLRAAAVLGVEFAVTDLATITGRRVPQLLEPFDEALAAGVLTESGDGMGFRHPLIRRALYEEIPAPERGTRHLEAGRALAAAGATAPRVARQLLQAVSPPEDDTGTGGVPDQVQPVDDWMLGWLGGTADALVSLAPGVAVELLGKAVADGGPSESARHGWLESRFADALYRVGNRLRAEEVATRTLAGTTDPDLRMDLQWTLTQCRMLAGQAVESLVSLNQALAEPGLPVRHRARLMVLAARTYLVFGETETAYRVATDALKAAKEARDTWATSWALNVLTMSPSVHGQPTDALPLFDQALALTQADPALSDLRLLLQVNKGIVLSTLDRHEQAFATLRPAMRLADQAGTAMRRAQAHSALGQALFTIGRWDDALAEIGTLPPDLKEPAMACCELALAATASFHRSDTEAARRQLASAAAFAPRTGHRVIPEFAMARSVDRETAGETAEALGILIDAITRGDGLGETEDLIDDAVRLATATGDTGTARSLADRAAAGAESQIPHRRASALHCQGLLDSDPARLLEAAQGYDDAGRPLMRAKALEAAAQALSRAGDSAGSRSALDGAVDIYLSLGATADVTRLKAGA